MQGLAGKTVIVTGGGGGIGNATCERLAQEGAQVAVLDRDLAAAQATAQRITAAGGKALAVAADITRRSEVDAAVQAVHTAFGPVDVLINNAGVEYVTPLSDTGAAADAHWQALLDNNVASMLRLTRALQGQLKAGSSVINQASIWGLKGVPGFSAYVASKHAVIGLTRSLAWELGPRHIRVNAVCPGWIGTDAAMRSLKVMAETNGRSEADELALILAAQAVPELLTPADLAGTFLFLGSALALPLTGQALSVSHGEVMH